MRTHSAETPPHSPAPGSGHELLPLIPLPWEHSQRFLLCRKPLLPRLLYNRPRLSIAAAPALAWSTVQQSQRPTGLLLRLLLISLNARSGCPAVPKLLSQAGHRVCKKGLLPRHVAGLYLLFFFFHYEHFLILMPCSFCLLQLVEGAGQLKHPDILYICKTQSYDLSEASARRGYTGASSATPRKSE